MLCISLFAACGAKNYTLTFVTNGGTEIAPITAEAGAEITPPADPEKSGFSFDGVFHMVGGITCMIRLVMPLQISMIIGRIKSVPGEPYPSISPLIVKCVGISSGKVAIPTIAMIKHTSKST